MQTSSADSRWVAERYRLDGQLGAGGMGVVWRGYDERLNRHVAVKEVVIPDGMPEAEAELLRERYFREARAAARLRHPGVVGVYDVIPETSRVWIVMELVHARDLAAILRVDGPLDPIRAARIGLQLLDALDAAHEAGVLHRDVKPANVLICENGRTVLTDFGVASVTGDSSLTRTGQLIGSPAYLAPERLTGGKVGPPNDLWSLGCTLYAAVEGRSPFARDEQFAIVAAITLEPVPHPHSAGLLAPVLYGLLDKDQAARWDSARARAALEQVAAGQPAESYTGWGAPGERLPSDLDSSSDALTVPSGMPVSGMPVSGMPVSGMPVSGMPVSGSPVSASPVSGSPVSGSPVSGRPISGLSVSGMPVSGLPASAVSAHPHGQSGTQSMHQPAPPGTHAADPTIGQPPAAVKARGSSGRVVLTTLLSTILVLSLAGMAIVYYVPSLLRVNENLPPSTPRTPQTYVTPTGTWQYTNPKFNYSVQIPGNWFHQCKDDEPKVGEQTCLFNSLMGTDRADREMINKTNKLVIYVHPANNKTPLELAGAEDTRWKNEPAFKDYKRVQLIEARLARYRKGSILEFTATIKATGDQRHVIIYRTVQNGLSYEVSLNAPEPTFRLDFPVWNRAVDTLDITAP